MYGTDSKEDKSAISISNSEETQKYPKAKNSIPVTPKMLMKALKKLEKLTLNRVVFSPREVMRQILITHPAVEQDPYALLLEVSDKLYCAAAAGLLGSRHDIGYFAFNSRQEEISEDSKSELMFWLYYKKLLKKRNEKRFEKALGFQNSQMGIYRNKEKKVLRLMSFTDDHFRFFPLAQYRRKIQQRT